MGHLCQGRRRLSRVPQAPEERLHGIARLRVLVVAELDSMLVFMVVVPLLNGFAVDGECVDGTETLFDDRPVPLISKLVESSVFRDLVPPSMWTAQPAPDWRRDRDDVDRLPTASANRPRRARPPPCVTTPSFRITRISGDLGRTDGGGEAVTMLGRLPARPSWCGACRPRRQRLGVTASRGGGGSQGRRRRRLLVRAGARDQSCLPTMSFTWSVALIL